MNYQIGDRVCVSYVPAAGDRLRAGMTGTVVHIVGNILYVDWDTDMHGHTCGGFARAGHGWKVRTDQVAPEIIITEDDPVDLSDLI